MRAKSVPPSVPHEPWLIERLKDPREAAAYLEAAIGECAVRDHHDVRCTFEQRFSRQEDAPIQFMRLRQRKHPKYAFGWIELAPQLLDGLVEFSLADPQATFWQCYAFQGPKVG